MLATERYWSRKGPPIPEFTDLPQGTTSGTAESWSSLSPGMRRTVWREAIHREAVSRHLPDDVLFRLKVATIDGSLATLDEYLMVFERQDAARSANPATGVDRRDLIDRKTEAHFAAKQRL